MISSAVHSATNDVIVVQRGIWPVCRLTSFGQDGRVPKGHPAKLDKSMQRYHTMTQFQAAPEQGAQAACIFPDQSPALQWGTVTASRTFAATSSAQQPNPLIGLPGALALLSKTLNSTLKLILATLTLAAAQVRVKWVNRI